MAVFRKVTSGREIGNLGAHTPSGSYLWKNCTVSRPFLALAALLLAVLPAAAQDMIWDDYGIGFKLPPGMKVTRDDTLTFTAQGNGLVLMLYAETTRVFTEEDLGKTVVSIAAETGYTAVSEPAPLDIDDLYGLFVEGALDGGKAFVLGIMNSLNDTGYRAVILFNDRSRNPAIDLLHSFYAYNE